MNATVTKSVAIDRAPADVFAFLADGANWPRWAVHNIFSSRRRAEGVWDLDTPRGPGELHLQPDRRAGTLDHAFVDAQQGHWDVPARVVPAGGGSVVILTLTQPAGMAEADFLAGAALLDEELGTLKRLLESKTEESRPAG